jgi:hypothetical protein
VAEYLVAEVLDRQSGAARRLLLRTSVLAVVSGPLADALTGGSGGERILPAGSLPGDADAYSPPDLRILIRKSQRARGKFRAALVAKSLSA